MNKKIAFVSAFVLASMSALAQENDSINKLQEVVISDSKFALSKEKSGKVIVKLTAEDLAKKSGQSIAMVLNSVAGLEINGSQSNAGKPVSVYVRGGRSRQTLILIDGIPMSDASGINLEYDLRLLPAEQVESIEIMKGAASTLYGSGAATGVINITLKKAAKKAFQGNAYMNVGTQETSKHENRYVPNEYNQGIGFSGEVSKFNYVAAINNAYVTGISEAKGDDFEADKFSRMNSVVKLGFKPTEKLSFTAFGSYDKMRNKFDQGAFFDGVEENALSEQVRAGLTTKYTYNKGEFVLNTAGGLVQREEFRFGGTTKYNSRNVNADAFNKYAISKQFFVVLGGQFQFYEMGIHSQYTAINKEATRFNIVDPYVTFVYNSEFGFNLNAGARYNIHNIYGEHLVYNINPSYSFKNLPVKLLASYSTAFITPSLYQLYDAYAGNVNLDPEENSTLESGVEVGLLNKKLNITAVGFLRKEKNAIDYLFDLSTFSSSYFNHIDDFTAKGVEASLAYTVTDKIQIKGNYTFTSVPNKPINNTFPDVVANLYNAKHKVVADFDYKISDRLNFNLNYLFSDKRDGFEGYPPVVVKLDAYKLLGSTIRYELSKNRMTVFASAYNIFNEEFVEVVGYNTRGRNFKVGFNFLF